MRGRDMQGVDERRARIAGRAVQEVGDREAPPRLPAVGGREVDERRSMRPPSAGLRNANVAIRPGGRRHRGDRRAEAAVEHVVVDVAGEDEQPASDGDGQSVAARRDARSAGRCADGGVATARASRAAAPRGGVDDRPDPAAAPLLRSDDAAVRASAQATIYDRPMARFRVIVADDHPLFREGVVRAVRAWPELEVVAEVSNGREALEQIRELAPDVALRRPAPARDRRHRHRQRRQRATDCRRASLLLSAFADDELVYRALEAGAAGYLTKDATQERDRARDPRRRERATRSSRPSSPPVSRTRSARARTATRRSSPSASARCSSCSARASRRRRSLQRLFLGTTTVKSHLGRLYEKLGVSDRAAAVAEAMRRGIVE